MANLPDWKLDEAPAIRREDSDISPECFEGDCSDCDWEAGLCSCSHHDATPTDPATVKELGEFFAVVDARNGDPVCTEETRRAYSCSNPECLNCSSAARDRHGRALLAGFLDIDAHRAAEAASLDALELLREAAGEARAESEEGCLDE